MGTLDATKSYGLLTAIAIVAAAVACIADVLLLYNPSGNYLSSNYAFLKDISFRRLGWGHYLGIFAIPLELLGLWPVYNQLKKGSRILSISIMGIALLTFFAGVAYHAMIAPLAELMKTQQTDKQSIESVKALLEPLGAITLVGFLLVSLLFSYTILYRKTTYPGWIALCSPILFYTLIVVIYLLWPIVGNVLVVAGFNLSILLFLSAGLIAEKKIR